MLAHPSTPTCPRPSLPSRPLPTPTPTSLDPTLVPDARRRSYGGTEGRLRLRRLVPGDERPAVRVRPDVRPNETGVTDTEGLTTVEVPRQDPPPPVSSVYVPPSPVDMWDWCDRPGSVLDVSRGWDGRTSGPLPT